VPFCAGFFFFFASPDEEGANVVAVFFTNLFKFLSNDDVEAEAEEDVENPFRLWRVLRFRCPRSLLSRQKMIVFSDLLHNDSGEN
jgi:hypothetical protein